MGKSAVSPEVKAAAIADLLSGEQPAVVADRYGLPAGTVRKWKFRLDLPVASHGTPDGTGNGTPDGTLIRQPSIEAYQRRIHELMYRLLIAKLEASERLAQHTQAGWLNRQSAEGIAELGDYFDRTAAGILALLVRPAGEQPGSQPEGDPDVS